MSVGLKVGVWRTFLLSGFTVPYGVPVNLKKSLIIKAYLVVVIAYQIQYHLTKQRGSFLNELATNSYSNLHLFHMNGS